MNNVPDIGDTFDVTYTRRIKWSWRRPFKKPWTYSRTDGYRVSAWLKPYVAPPLDPAADHQTLMVIQILQELRDEGKIPPPRGFGPDNIPLVFCTWDEAVYISGSGIAGTIQRVSDITITGRVPWSDEFIQSARDHANMLAGERLF